MRFFPREKGKTAFVEGFSLTKAVFPFSRGKNRISQGVENRGSLISVPFGPQGSSMATSRVGSRKQARFQNSGCFPSGRKKKENSQRSPIYDFPLLRPPHLSGPVLRGTARLSQRYPPIARYGVFGVSTWPIGCDTPSPFSERFPLGEHAKWGCDTPPEKGYLSDTCAIPYENKANGCDTPLCDTISKGYCAIWGGYLALGR